MTTFFSCKNFFFLYKEGNILADSPGSQTEKVSLETLSFVYFVLLFFVNIFV